MKVRKTSNLIGSLAADLSKIDVEDKSILVLRSDRDWSEMEMKHLQNAVDEALPPNAQNLLLVIRTDESFETINSENALKIYTELKKMFEPDAISLQKLQEYVMRATMGHIPEEAWKFLEALFIDLKEPVAIEKTETIEKQPSDGGENEN